ncbi:hypothetical protein [Proteiniborus sp. MB09-C3]|uniref:hypothetical protein n=1 Tax=Proteiniborus sp. MB09-C3 TaxID=3050072 RepID=UPI0025553B15|nr:hypothetical protein [Proteiniborus sp. MB09-C3]WIV10464.1 hypothetical protein QO263_09845 [Proteiniborus sp. MB09-C3]
MGDIILSTAAFCLWDIEPIEKLKITKDLKFNDIQIALSTEKMLRNFLEYLNNSLEIDSFQKISIHAPWCGVTYGENDKTERILEYLLKVSNIINIDIILFRVDCIRDINPIIKSGLPICLENSNKKGCWRKFRSIAEKHDFPLALNINRALRGDDYLDDFIAEYGSRIERILISGYDSNNGRMPLLLAKQLHLLEKIKEIKAPLVLDGLFEPGDREGIIKERYLVKEYIKHINDNESPDITMRNDLFSDALKEPWDN